MSSTSLDDFDYVCNELRGRDDGSYAEFLRDVARANAKVLEKDSEDSREEHNAVLQ